MGARSSPAISPASLGELLVGGGAFDQARGIGRQVVGHGLSAADLRANPFPPELLGDPVMDEPLTQSHDLNVGGPSLPNLPLGQLAKAISFDLHPSI